MRPSETINGPGDIHIFMANESSSSEKTVDLKYTCNVGHDTLQ